LSEFWIIKSEHNLDCFRKSITKESSAFNISVTIGKAQADALTAAIKVMREAGIEVEVDVVFDQRTSAQNRALHRYFRVLAAKLNAAGLDMRKLLKPEVEIPWSLSSVKEFLWKRIQLPLVGHDSTSKLDKKQVGEVYETLSRHLSEKHGIYVPFRGDQ